MPLKRDIYWHTVFFEIKAPQQAPRVCVCYSETAFESAPPEVRAHNLKFDGGAEKQRHIKNRTGREGKNKTYLS